MPRICEPILIASLHFSSNPAARGAGAKAPRRAEIQFQPRHYSARFLSENCFSCHGPDRATRQGGAAAGHARGGGRRTGQTAGRWCRGNPTRACWSSASLAESRARGCLPVKSGRKLTGPANRSSLRRPGWIRGRPMSGTGVPLPAAAALAFCPPSPPRTGPRHPLDTFVLARLERGRSAARAGGAAGTNAPAPGHPGPHGTAAHGRASWTPSWPIAQAMRTKRPLTGCWPRRGTRRDGDALALRPGPLCRHQRLQQRRRSATIVGLA